MPSREPPESSRGDTAERRDGPSPLGTSDQLRVLMLLVDLSPRREALLARAREWRPRIWLGWALPGILVFLAAWLGLFSALPVYSMSLARESGPLEPLQTGLYACASWLALRCAARPLGTHDFIALGVKIPAVCTALIALAVTLLALGVWFVGPRAVLRQVRSVAAVPSVLAVAALALAQVLDQSNSALADYSRLLEFRLEEPLELVTATLINVTLLVKYGELARRRAVVKPVSAVGDR